MGGPAERKAVFLNKILPLIAPGDVINFDSSTEWYNLHIRLGYWGIRDHQHKVFGNLSRWRDTHSMLYLDEDQILSVEPPRARWAKLADLHDDKITVWRYTKREFSDEDIDTMIQVADAELIGTIYDIGQLIDIAINRIMGYPHTIAYRIFDFSKYCKVCSVGVRVCYEALRKKLEAAGDNSMPRLFSKFKYDTWLSRPEVMEGNTELRGVDVEATAPAHFANSEWFDDEFEMVCQFDCGQQIIPPPPPPPEPQPTADDHGHGDDSHAADSHAAH